MVRLHHRLTRHEFDIVMDREAWQAADHGVAAWTGLSVGVGQDLVTEQQ